MVDIITKHLSDKILFKKYKIKKLLSSTAFSNVYEGVNINNKMQVAIKIEKQGKFEFLEAETFLLMNLKGLGIPEIISYGKHGPFKILIQELLGPDLEYLFSKFVKKKESNINSNMFINDVYLFAIQALDRLEYIHSKDIVHRDIKTGNFLIGRKEPDIIYLIDFGFSKKYKSSRTGKHIKYSNTKSIIGSLFFASINALKGFEHSRRDDLESFGYVIIYLANKGVMPWSKYYKKENKEFGKIKKLKIETSEEVLCKGLPNIFSEYIKYVKKLEFEQKPDYKYLRNLFINALSKNVSRNEMNKNIKFFWIKPEEKWTKTIKTNFDDLGTMLKKTTLNKKKSNSLNKMYHQIKFSMANKESNKFISNNESDSSLKLEKTFQSHTNQASEKSLSNNLTHKINIQTNPSKKINTNLDLKSEIKKNDYFGILKDKKLIININKKEKSDEKGLIKNRLYNLNNKKNKEEKNIRNNIKKNIKRSILDFSTNIQAKATYNNINYNNLYFINNYTIDNKIYQSLNKNTSINSNFSRYKGNINIINNSITLNRNKVYRPIFKANSGYRNNYSSLK